MDALEIFSNALAKVPWFLPLVFLCIIFNPKKKNH